MPLGYLSVSGVSDGLTIEAIKQFQLRVVKRRGQTAALPGVEHYKRWISRRAAGPPTRPSFVAGGEHPQRRHPIQSGADGRYTITRMKSLRRKPARGERRSPWFVLVGASSRARGATLTANSCTRRTMVSTATLESRQVKALVATV